MTRTFSATLDVRLPGALVGLPVPIAGHCADNGKVILNFPGWNGTMNGYEQKYVKLGENLASTGLASFVRTEIPAGVVEYSYSEVAQEVVRTAVNYVLAHSEGITGSSRKWVHLYLIGTSAGAGAISAVAHEFSQVRKLLLIAPAFSETLVGKEATNGISLFIGDVAIVVGNRDSKGIFRCAQALRDHAVGANSLRFQVVDNADHHFSGKENGKLVSLLPKWAFASREVTLPDPSAGIELY